MRYVRIFVFAMCIVAWFAVVAFEANEMKDDMEKMQADIAQIQQVSPLNQSCIEEMKATNKVLVARGFELEELKRWLIEPEKKKFPEACATFKSLGYENAKNLLFKRYIESEVLEQYLVYISGDGVRNYKHSYIANGMVSEQNDWWDKSLYNSVDNVKVSTVDVIIPDELLASKRRLANFLDDMGYVFVEK